MNSAVFPSAGVHYPDFEVASPADNHIIVKYNPELSDDLTAVGRAGLYPFDGRQVWGRVFLVAVPPDGNLTFSASYSPAGAIALPSSGQFISAETPLVVVGPAFSLRGHRLVRMMVFPQRHENGRLAVYRDFVIDIRLSGSEQPARPLEEFGRLDSVIAGTAVNSDQFYRFGTAARPQVMYKQTVDPFGEADHWVKVGVSGSGIMGITGAALSAAGIDLTDLQSDSIRVYYGGGMVPPDTGSGLEPQLYQVAIRIEDGGDGRFGAGDNILFYAEGADRYDYGSGGPLYIENHYNDMNYYWVSIGGHETEALLRWQMIDGTPNSSPDQIATTSRRRNHLEQSNILKIDSDGRMRNYYEWFWTDQGQGTVTANLVDCVPGDSIEVLMAAISSFTGTEITLNGTDMFKANIGDDFYRFWDNTGAAVPGLNTLNFRINGDISGRYLDYLDIDYPAWLRVGGSQLEFNSKEYAGQVQYRITGYSPSHHIVDISDPDNPALVTGVEIRGDTARFQRPASSQSIARYTVYSFGTVHAPSTLEKTDPGDLRRDLNQYDCLVISPRRLQSALNEYVSHRQTTGGYRVKLAAVEDVYAQFGFGLESPMAIRSYLHFAYENCEPPAPFAVLLVGDGHYDFLDRQGTHAPSYIPPFIWNIEFSAGDDNYAYFGPYGKLDSDSSLFYQGDRGWDMMVGRWPVRTAAEVSAHIAKLKAYESQEAQGAWRGRVTFVADDEFKHEGGDREIIHTAQAETLAVYHTPQAFVKNKIYATDYPFASNGEKPSVNEAIIKAVNDGTLILNYIGHGSPDVWADEHILKKAVDLVRMQNSDRPTIVVAGSCSIGFFDDPVKEGMAEIMFRQPGGALETVSATRLVYATDNAIFSYDLYDALFGNHCNVSEAVFTAKVLHQYAFNNSLVRNDRSYVVFGDPLARVSLPEYTLEFSPVADSTLTALKPFAFSGTVTDHDGNPVAVNGAVDVTVYDSRIVRHHPLGIDYSLGGPIIFRGPVDVVSGAFAGAFVVPLDVDYGGQTAQIIGYGSFAGVSGIGGIDSLSISTTAAPTVDNTGPQITYSIEEVPEFASGDRVPANATVIIDIHDESGINLTGGLGHRVELIVDNDNSSTVNLTSLFTYASGSWQTGGLRFTLPSLTPERHDFKIRAWDNANNPAVIEFEAVPSQESHIAIHELMNYPNPMEERTEFFFELSESAEWAELQIFTLAGRLIYRYRAEDLPIGRNRLFPWNGCDLDGDRVAQGVYMYKITVKGHGAKKAGSADIMTEAFSKLIVLN